MPVSGPKDKEDDKHDNSGKELEDDIDTLYRGEDEDNEKEEKK